MGDQSEFSSEVVREIFRTSRKFSGPSQATMEGRKKISGRGTSLLRTLKMRRILYVLQYLWGMTSEGGK